MKKNIFFFIFFSLFLPSCATSPLGRKQLNLISDHEMSQMGHQSFEEIKKTTPIETNIELNGFVNCVANKIIEVTNSEYKINHWEVKLFNSNEVNAFALPGGKIGIYKGLLKITKTQSQLAAVIGHEVGHVIANHGNERVSQSLSASIGVSIIESLTGKSDPNTKKIILAGLGLGIQYGIILPFSRSHETESDLIGLRLMSLAGFDPREAPQVWKNMSELRNGGSIPEFLSTHPSDETRINHLNDRLLSHISIYEKARIQGKNPICKFPTD